MIGYPTEYSVPTVLPSTSARPPVPVARSPLNINARQAKRGLAPYKHYHEGETQIIITFRSGPGQGAWY